MRRYISGYAPLGGLLALALVFSGCNGGGEEEYEIPVMAPDPLAADYPGLDELSRPITALSAACTWASTGSGTVTITVDDGETAIVSRNTAGTIFVNSQTCTGSGTTATSSNTKIINISSQAANESETVIIDYSFGTFGLGTTTAGTTGIRIDLGTSGTDAVKIRGSENADNYSLGKDTYYYIAANTDSYPDVVMLNTPDTIVISAGPGADRVYAGGGYGTGNAVDMTLTIYGGEGNDTLTGGTAADTIKGGTGNDLITGSTGDDSLYGEGGNDTFGEGSSNSGTDYFSGGDDTDTVDYSSRTLALTISITGTGASGVSGENDNIQTNVENVKGGSAADVITGSSSANTIYGYAGNDTIYGKAGDDSLYGGDGNDTFYEDGTEPNGSDVISGDGGTSDLVDYTSRTGALTITINNTANDGESGENDNIMTTVEHVKGSTVGDTITGSSSDNTIWGYAGNDTIDTGSGADVIYGGLGDDVLTGGSGDDTFYEEGSGTNGADTFNGGTGVDTVDYTSRTAAVTVTMDGAAANDGESSETDDVKDDVERLNCPTGSYVCTVTGNALRNEITGGDGDDVLTGGDGDDILDGGAGDNWLAGGDGDGDVCFSSPTGTTGTETGCEL